MASTSLASRGPTNLATPDMPPPAPHAETRLAELKRYIGLSADEAALLAGFRDTAAPHFERIAQEFYDQIRLHEDAHAVFTGEAQIARLQRSLVRWLGRVFGGTYDEAYFAETTAIGRVHVVVGLPQRYMLTAMALIRLSLMDLAEASGPRGFRVARAVCRLLDLELAIMLESYRDDSIARVRHAERLEKEALGRDLAQTQHRYVNAVELACVLIVGLDDDGVVRLWNREAERVTGYDRDEALGRPLLAALGVDPDGEGASVRGWFAEFAAAGRSAPASERPPIEMAICTRARHPRVIRWHFTHAPVEDDDVSVFALGRDITDERPCTSGQAAGATRGDRHPRRGPGPRDPQPAQRRPAPRHRARPGAPRANEGNAELLESVARRARRDHAGSAGSSPSSSTSPGRGRCRSSRSDPGGARARRPDGRARQAQPRRRGHGRRAARRRSSSGPTAPSSSRCCST
jgi:PAS domain S-box-containing protein